MKVRAYGPEILPAAVRVTASRYPEDTQLGDITKVQEDQYEQIAEDAK